MEEGGGTWAHGGLSGQCAHGPPNTRILPCYEIEPKLHKWGGPDLESFGVCVLVPFEILLR